jgi:signal transduction histidine kinase
LRIAGEYTSHFFATKRNLGTGLGLWVTREIVEKHGGKIYMRSSVVGPRTGTVFSILLPQRKEHP